MTMMSIKSYSPGLPRVWKDQLAPQIGGPPEKYNFGKAKIFKVPVQVKDLIIVDDKLDLSRYEKIDYDKNTLMALIAMITFMTRKSPATMT